MWMLWRDCWGLYWTIDSCCSSTRAPMLLLEVTLGVSMVTEDLWGLKGVEAQMVFSSVPPVKGKGWGMIAGSCRSTPVLTTGVCYWLWDLLCGSSRWDPLDKGGWEYLFQQTGQSSEESLKLWTAGEGYNEWKSNAQVQDWVGERRVQYGRHKSKEALASRTCIQKHVAWEMKRMNWSSKSSHRATALLE